jgi:hypothetical protein
VNLKQPLWLPPGSVRAILALLVVGGGMAMFWQNRSIPDALANIMIAVVIFYFQKQPATG